VLPLKRYEVKRYEEPDFNAIPPQVMIQEQKEVIEKQNELL
jgi:hypothetical protein